MLVGLLLAGGLAACGSTPLRTSLPLSPASTPPPIPVASLMASPAPSPAHLSTGVRGTVTAGPTCPVERLDSPCPPRPVMALVEAHTAKGQVIAIVNSGSDGSYAISLPPGSYTLVVAALGAFPRCPQAAAVVPPRAVAVVDIDCDTGIR